MEKRWDGAIWNPNVMEQNSQSTILGDCYFSITNQVNKTTFDYPAEHKQKSISLSFKLLFS